MATSIPAAVSSSGHGPEMAGLSGAELEERKNPDLGGHPAHFPDRSNIKIPRELFAVQKEQVRARGEIEFAVGERLQIVNEITMPQYRYPGSRTLECIAHRSQPSPLSGGNAGPPLRGIGAGQRWPKKLAETARYVYSSGLIETGRRLP
jgi:hypothetical protein